MGSATRLIGSTRVDGHPQFSPDGKRIAFHSNRTGSFEIFICDSDGSNPQQLTSRGPCGNPHWSLDGEQIAVDSASSGTSQSCPISINAANVTPWTSGPDFNARPNWSSDGKWIYFLSDRSGDWQIWKVSASGGDAVRVTRNGGVVACESPDGQWAYFVKRDGRVYSLWRVPTNGGEESRVLESANEIAIVREGVYFAPGRKSAASPYPISIRFL